MKAEEIFYAKNWKFSWQCNFKLFQLSRKWLYRQLYHMLQVAQMKGIKLCARKLISWPMGNNALPDDTDDPIDDEITQLFTEILGKFYG